MVSVSGNFLDEVLMRSKEILNHIHKLGPIEEVLRQLFEWCKDSERLDAWELREQLEDSDFKEEFNVIKTEELIRFLEFILMPNDHCGRIVRDIIEDL